ncbi:glycosyltransferase family 4 protein [Clostridiaceae bacterium 35-E11]
MKKKILFMEARYQTLYGGQKSMIKLMNILSRENFEIKALLGGEGKLKAVMDKQNIAVDVIKLGKKADVFGGKILKYSFLEKMIVFIQLFIYNLKLILYLKKNRIDIVYVNNLRTCMYVFFAAKLLRKKIVIYIREEIKDTFLTKVVLFFADEIITIANGVLKNISKKITEKYKNKITNIYTGFEFEKFYIAPKDESKRRLNLDWEKIVVGFVGSINKRKGVDILVEALLNISKVTKNIVFVIAGDVIEGHALYWKELQEKMAKNQVEYKHIKYQTDVSLVYNAIDILVLPSRSEGLSRTVIEGMSHRLPVIATDAGGTQEIIENKSLGIVIPKNSTKLLVEALFELINSPELQKQIGEKAKKHVEKKFNEKEFEKKINALFNKI